MGQKEWVFRAIGYVRNRFSEWTEADVMRQEESELVLDPAFVEGLEGLQPGDGLMVIYVLDRVKEIRLKVHPRGDPTQPVKGVFATRSPYRPNPIGLTGVRVVAIEGPVVRVRGLDALDGSPILDLKIASDMDRPPDL
ncbi:tRNA (N6-threonylcarbamoyladenosine(37)-N6)-methyltransferase TrmO [Thermoflexus sp.]|uniref:tRNA (N6-threonylcarbamoyladenosine(37)-N6)-methyltransferase TrmO n=1 Tax=Thermoflexus sp. TaxID=1969742 RepID=UPI00176D1AED|nr:tRNA (N6-threonylcarbamoyladenosine(37)-N6)-methyltransferase TrmO [Thermoflexus sp.]